LGFPPRNKENKKDENKQKKKRKKLAKEENGHQATRLLCRPDEQLNNSECSGI
jgi:hypothetical protein